MVAAYQEAARVLRPGGRLVTVSHTSRKHIIDALALPFIVREARVLKVLSSVLMYTVFLMCS